MSTPNSSSYIAVHLDAQADAHAQKLAIAQAALNYLRTHAQQQIIGIGTGSTVNCLIQALAPYVHEFKGAVSSSHASSELLKKINMPIITTDELPSAGIELYIDGADEINEQGIMIKGGGGALTREKIVANYAKNFICIADVSKKVPLLGAFAIPIEVLPMAVPSVIRYFQQHYPDVHACVRQMVSTGNAHTDTDAQSKFLTDNYAHIIDLHGLRLTPAQAIAFETRIKQVVGVIEVGIFAQHSAKCLMTLVVKNAQTCIETTIFNHS